MHCANPGCRLPQDLLWTCVPLVAIATSEVRPTGVQQRFYVPAHCISPVHKVLMPGY